MAKEEGIQTAIKDAILALVEAMPVSSPEDDSKKQSLNSALSDLFSSTKEHKPVVLYEEHSDSAAMNDSTRRFLTNQIIYVLFPRLWLKKSYDDTQRDDVKYSVYKTVLPDIVLVEERQWSDMGGADCVSVVSLQEKKCWEPDVRPDGVYEVEG